MTTWLCFKAPPKGRYNPYRTRYDLANEATPTIGAGGFSARGDYWFEHDDLGESTMTETKPPYRVPLLSEIRKIPWNGFTVATTFAGTGGSSLGYRMAGFKVVWANEFVPIAQDSYRANMGDGTVLDCRDIKQVEAADILKATGLKVGDLDVFDGSPPCQAFSTAGRREKGWGTERKYAHGASQKNEELFTDYIRLLRGLKPRTFVAENVSGLVKGVAKGFFLNILAELKASGYAVKAAVLDAQWLGVPQQRQRVIFLGVRNDLGVEPSFPAPWPYRYSVRDAIPWICAATHDTGGFTSAKEITDRPCPTVTAGPNDARDGSGPHYHFKVEIAGNKNAPHGRKNKRYGVEDPAPTVMSRRVNLDVEQQDMRPGVLLQGEQVDWKNEGKPIDVEAPSPTIAAGVASRREPRQFTVQVGANDGFGKETWQGPDQPAKTIGTTPNAGNGRVGAGELMITETGEAMEFGPKAEHPVERRKFSIAELKRICAFPDDVKLIGTYAQQWERLGNSVPPLMMRAVAEVVRDRVLVPCAPPGRAAAKRPARPRGSSARSTKGSRPKGAGTSPASASASPSTAGAASPRARTRPTRSPQA